MMLLVCECRALLIMVLMTTHGQECVFIAYKENMASTTGVPRLIQETSQVFHQNGFHGEIIARAAMYEEECGVVLLGTIFVLFQLFTEIN